MSVSKILCGTVTGILVGASWVWLYWDNYGHALLVVLAHLLAGAGLTLFLLALRARRSLGIVGATVGALWLAPVALFLIDVAYFDLRARLLDLAVVAVVVAGGFLLGLLAGSARFGPLGRAAILMIVVAGAPIVSHLTIGEGLVSRVRIADRVTDLLPGAMASDGPGRIMVLGIDGAGWNVLLPMVADGRAPNLRKLMERGQYGVLKSVRSPSGEIISPTVWSSIFTGVSPERHGITEWARSDSRNRARSALWNIVNRFGGEAVVVNVPGSFPSEVVRGRMVSGFPLPGVTRPAGDRFGADYGALYTTRPRTELQTVPVHRLALETLDSGPDSFSPVLRSDLPLYSKLDRRYGALGLAAHRLGVGSFFMEFLWKRGFPGPRPLATLTVSLVDRTDDGERNYDTAVLEAPESREARAELRDGDWTPWIPLHAHGASLTMRLKLVELEDDHVTLFATPVFQDNAKPVVPFTYPPELAPELGAPGGQPYVVEGVGWYVHEDAALLDALYEHTVETGAVRARAAEALLEATPDWNLFVHVFTETDRVQHPFWRFHRPLDYGLAEEVSTRRHRGKVEDVFERVDVLIGELLAHADASTTIAIVSDHGFTSAVTGIEGAHSPEGIYVLAGPNVRGAGKASADDPDSFPTMSALDVVPTLAYLSGYPVARDWDGEVALDLATAACVAESPVAWIETYEDGSSGTGEEAPLDPATIEQLRSLGYLP